MYASYSHLLFWATPVTGWLSAELGWYELMPATLGFIRWIWIGEITNMGTITVILLEVGI